MGSRLGALVVALAAVGAGAFMFVRHRSQPASNDDLVRMRGLEARVASLERQGSRAGVVARPLASGETHLTLPVQPGNAAPESGVKKQAAEPLTEAQELALQREYFGELDVRLGGEGRDPIWSAATEERLRTSVRDLRPRITVDNARCGQTMCRVEISVPDPREASAALDKFLAASLDLLPEAVVQDGDGPGRHVVYFARKGAEGFPPMNAPEARAQ